MNEQKAVRVGCTDDPRGRHEAIARIQTMEAEREWVMDHIAHLNRARDGAVKRLGLLCELIAIERESVLPNHSVVSPATNGDRYD